MSKRGAIILAVVGLCVGLVTGGWSFSAIYKHRINRLITDSKYHENEMAISSLTSDAEIRVFELRYLRAGKMTNAVDDEELHLEGDLINLEMFVADSNEFRSHPPYMSSLREVKAYRAEYPYKAPPSVEEGVAEVFTLLDVQTNH